MSITLGGGITFGAHSSGQSDLRLEDLFDVNAVSKQDGQFLKYNGSTLEWENKFLTNADLQVIGTAGTYNTVTTNDRGIVTSGTNVGYLTANQPITVTGDATGSGTTTITLTLANSGVSVGVHGDSTSIPVFTTDAKGRVTSVTETAIPNATTVASGLLSNTDKVKLNGIDIGAQVNQLITPGSGLTGSATNGDITVNIGQGDGILIGADTVSVDGTVLRSSGSQSISGNLTVTGNLVVGGSGGSLPAINGVAPFVNLNFDATATGSTALPAASNGGVVIYRGGTGAAPADTVSLQWNESAQHWEAQNAPGQSYGKIWHSLNDGTGSGLDADLLDGNDSAYFTNADNMSSGTLSASRLPIFSGDVTSVGNTSALTLTTSGVVAGTYGSSVLIPQIDVDSKGRVTSVSTNSIPSVTTATSGLMTASDKTKLDGIATGATANQTITAGSGLTGGGSGNSVTLGVDGTVLRTTGGATVNGDWTFNGNVTITGTVTENEVTTVHVTDTRIFLNSDLVTGTPTTDAGVLVSRGSAAHAAIKWNETSDKWQLSDGLSDSDLVGTFNDIWHSGNDGAGSGLDADLLDGNQGSFYLDLANATGTLPTASFGDATHGSRSGGSLHSVATVSTAGFMSAADKTKLDGISAGASGDQTIVAGAGLTGGGTGATVTVDVGAGSGITVGSDSISVDSTVLRTTGGQTVSSLNVGTLTVTGTTTFNNVTSVSTTDPFIALNSDYTGGTPTENQGLVANRGSLSHSLLYWDEAADEWAVGTNVALDVTSPTKTGNIWHSGNDGAGSGLDADLLDGNQGSFYQNASNLTTGTLAVGRLPAFTGDATTTAGTSAITLASTGVVAGTYGNSTTQQSSFTVDAKGRITAVGAATTITPAFSSLTGKPTTLSGYGITDAQDLDATLTSLSAVSKVTTGLVKLTNGTASLDSTAYLTDNQTITVTGDATGSGTTAIALTLANSGATAGTYNNSPTSLTPYVIDAKGRITATGSSVTITPAFSNVTDKPTTTAGYGITDAITTAGGQTIGGTLGLTGALSGTSATFTGACNAASFNATSSIRFKENVKTIEDDLVEKFQHLRAVTYDRIENGKAEIGFIAEEVNELFPEIVHRLEDGVVEGIDYSRMTSILVAKVQKQDSEIAELKALVASLINKSN